MYALLRGFFVYENNISDFLDINDIIQFKNVSKFYHKLFIVYIRNLLENDKMYFNKKLKNLGVEDSIPPNQTIINFNLFIFIL